MKKWIFEYETYWFDCDATDYEQTLCITAETKTEAVELGKKKIREMDKNDNESCGSYWNNVDNPLVTRTYRRCMLDDFFCYTSSVKEPNLNGHQGYVDVVKWKGI